MFLIRVTLGFSERATIHMCFLPFSEKSVDPTVKTINVSEKANNIRVAVSFCTSDWQKKRQLGLSLAKIRPLISAHMANCGAVVGRGYI